MAAQCPSPEQLSAYAAGAIAESSAANVAAHIDGCRRCQMQIDTLVRKSDSLLTPLRKQAVGQGGGASPVMEKLVAQAANYQPTSAAAAATTETDKSSVVDRATFVRVLRKSGLMESAEIDEAETSIAAASVPEFALELVRRRKLTRYQAGILARGKSKGLVLGNYVLLEKVGQGGMGMVFKARHKRMDRVVALKILPPSATKSAEAVERFRREVQTAGRLHHENIVVAHDADEAASVFFLVMEYVPGSDLGALVKKKGPLPVAQAVNCVLQAARGLQYAHEQGIIHRDIKPNNLLLDTSGTVKILDMGLARVDSALHGGDGELSSADLTGTGTVMGTIDYMAPEQALNAKNADHRADIYSLGCTLHYLLTGRSVFGGTTIMERLVAHREAAIPSLPAACKSANDSLDGVFQRMLAKQPDQRYASMDELVADLERLSSGEPVTIPALSDLGTIDDLLRLDDVTAPDAAFAQTISTTTTGRAHDTQLTPLGAPPPRSVKRGRRVDRRIVVGAAIAAGVVLVAALGIVIVKAITNPDDVAAGDDDAEGAPFSGFKTDNRASFTAPSAKDGGMPFSHTANADHVLLIVPHEGYWYPDFAGVTAALRQHDIGFVVASSRKGPAKTEQKGVPPLEIDTTLDEVDADDFDAVIFCGGNVEEFKTGNARKPAQRIIHEMKQRGKLVCSICTGDEVLDAAGVLHDVVVAKCDFSTLKSGKAKISGDAKPVWCGNFVTAGHADQSYALVDKIAEAIKSSKK